MSNRILIFGKGYIGIRLQAELKCWLSAQRIQTYADIEKEILRYKPKVIVNCIGATGEHNVDDCEKDIDKTLFSNSYIPLLMGEAAYRHNIKLVHISSGCIYHYDYTRHKPISENNIPDYFDLFYSRTKIYSDRALEELAKAANILILRIRIPLDDISHPKNLINKLVKYQKVIDTPNSVTYIPDFLEAFKFLVKKDRRGIYNIALKGGLYFPDLMEEYKKYVPDYQYKIITLKQLGLTRSNLILSTRKLEREGFKVKKVKQAVKECLAKYFDK
ncbi:MAG: sugar nucleotide-binding protein [Candidatus Omnitrophica bacterium]|nr:sugar nucleotide-binding protein [Candidatus Omnitrophota bacterium]